MRKRQNYGKRSHFPIFSCMCMMIARSCFPGRVLVPGSAGERKGLLWPPQSHMVLVWWAPCAPRPPWAPRAQPRGRAAVPWWNSCFPASRKGWASQAGKQRRKRGAEASMAMGTVQSGMPKIFHFAELYNGIFCTAALLSFSCNCPGFQLNTVGLKPDTQNMKNT